MYRVFMVKLVLAAIETFALDKMKISDNAMKP